VVSKGEVYYNPVTHEQFTFIQTAAESNGRATVFELSVTPGGATLPAHVHAYQEERFTVISGTLGVMVGGKKHTLYPGQSISLPRRVKHQWWNAGDYAVRFRVEVLPSRSFDAVIESVVGLALEGKLNKNGMPRNPFLLASFAKLSECYLPGIPLWIQKPMVDVGSAIGAALGYDPSFRRYRAEATATATMPAQAAA
jgi:quercetin dioxygenase-like cupin family protein